MIQAGPLHAAVLATIHAEAFPPGERWTAAALAGVLDMPGVWCLLDERGGFALAREAGGEAELLTLAVAPAARRLGIARALVTRVLDRATGPVFLEVAAHNGAALGLYRSAGFVERGRRRHYYGPGRDALILRRDPPCRLA